VDRFKNGKFELKNGDLQTITNGSKINFKIISRINEINLNKEFGRQNAKMAIKLRWALSRPYDFFSNFILFLQKSFLISA
jgi:hypothetical protein